jgi:hypothetical protein
MRFHVLARENTSGDAICRLFIAKRSSPSPRREFSRFLLFFLSMFWVFFGERKEKQQKIVAYVTNEREVE